MAGEVTYLLGAGASRGKRTFDKNPTDFQIDLGESTIIEGLPLVYEIPKRIEYIIKEIEAIPISDKNKGLNIKISPTGDASIMIIREQLIDELRWLAKESARHATIDTLARQLYLTQKTDDFRRLKTLLSIYFIIEQIINKADNRYDSFLANVLTSSNHIDDKINILTWNYDSQFEIALKEFYPEITVPADAGVCSMFDGGNNVCHCPRIYKINGSASFTEEYSLGRYCLQDECKLNEEHLIRLLNMYACNNSTLSFAWDFSHIDDHQRGSFWGKARASISNTKVLVVIGYSFPFFNRETDRQIISYMQDIEKIYIQDTDSRTVKQNMRAVLERSFPSRSMPEIELLDSVEQFFLPPEL